MNLIPFSVPMVFISSFLFVLLGVLSIALFHLDFYLPIWLSVISLILVTLFLLRQYRNKRLGVLMLLIWFVYVLPFVHILPYLWFDFDSNPPLLWGLAVNPYMVDKRVITLTAMIGAVGGMGIALGSSLSKRKIQQDFFRSEHATRQIFPAMPLSLWFIWVGFGVMLSVLSSPQEAIFTAAYTGSKSLLDGANFSSAWMISYVVLTFALCDALFENPAWIKNLKTKVLLATIVWVVVFCQILRGDREFISWVFGLVLLYYYWAASITQRLNFLIPWFKILGGACGLFGISFVLGSIRLMVAGASLVDAGALVAELYQSVSFVLANALSGTWSAVLLTPLSVAGDHMYGLLPIKWAKIISTCSCLIFPVFLLIS